MKVPFLELRDAYNEVGGEIDDVYKRVMASGWYAMGPELEAFENEFASYCGVSHCVGVGSGTEALWLTLLGYGIGSDDEVITVSNSFIATALAIEQANARPVFVDVEPHSLTMDPTKLEAAIGPRTRAIMPVHLFGRCAEMEAINAVAQRHGLKVIEDSAQAHGATYAGRRAGSLGDAACFSFYPTKNLGAFGQGGAVLTNDAQLAEELRMLRNYGQKERYHHEKRGYNSRLDDLQAGFLRVNLRHLERWNEHRNLCAEWYRQGLAAADVELLPAPQEGRHAYHLFVIRSRARASLQASLRAARIDSLIHYPIPIHKQVAFADRSFALQTLPITELAAAEVLSLPMHPWLTREAVEHVCRVVTDSAKGA